MSCRSCNDRIGSSIVRGAAGLIQSELNIGVAADEVIAARRAACEACDQWDHGRCKSCGCYTFAKTRLRSEKCPLGKWDA
jgi:hypothetical protein